MPTPSLSKDDFRELLAQVESTEATLVQLKNRVKEEQESDLKRVSRLFKVQHGADLGNFIVYVGLGNDYINLGYLAKYIGENHETTTAKLLEMGWLKVHYVFFDPNNDDNQLEVSEQDFLEYSTPNERGMCTDPIVGEECPPERLCLRYYKYYSTTDAYTEFVKLHSITL